MALQETPLFPLSSEATLTHSNNSQAGPAVAKHPHLSPTPSKPSVVRVFDLEVTPHLPNHLAPQKPKMLQALQQPWEGLLQGDLH